MFILIPLVFQLLFSIFIFFLCIAFITGAPFVPSTGSTTKRMIELAHISSNSIVYDLGSGDGRLLFAAAKQGAKKVIGVEINPWLVLLTKIRIYVSPYRNIIRCTLKNFWSVDLTSADVVFIYLLPWKMDTLGAKLKKELKPGSRIVSNSFIFPKWEKIAFDEKLHVYVFQIYESKKRQPI